MYLLVWLLAFPTLLCHSLFSLLLIFIFLYHKASHCLFKSPATSARVAHYQDYLKSKQVSLVRMYKQKFGGSSAGAAGRPLFASSSVVVLLVCLVLLQQSGVWCLEEDAKLMKPFADVAKSLISAMTLGKPLAIEIQSSDLVRSLAKFSWRTGFPITMPTNFLEAGSQFYNELLARVSQANVDNVTRKRLASLKVDMDNIVDSLVEHVRQSPQGLYSDWRQARVGELNLEEACYNIGLQFKGYGIDISNYRNIAGAVLGVPVVPTVAGHVVTAGKAARSMAAQPINRVASFSGQAMNSLSSNMLPFGGAAGRFALGDQPAAGSGSQQAAPAA